jgi:DnaJ-domain-containing protein 1
VTDYFTLLRQPRAPWLELSALERAYLDASKAAHPDRVHGQSVQTREAAHARAVDVNQAHLCLREPRTRLRHFLELERASRIADLQEIPDDLMQLFTEVGGFLKAADQLASTLEGVTSPLLKAAEFAKGQELQDAMQDCQRRIGERTEALEEQVKILDADWRGLAARDTVGRETLLSRLETIYRLLSFYERWKAQLQARTLKLLDVA